MSRTRSARARLRSYVVAAAFALVAAGSVGASIARAELGAVVDTAGTQASQAVGQRPADGPGAGGKPVTFTDVLLELRSERLDHVLAGLEAGRGSQAGRGALVASKSRLLSQVSELIQKNGPALDTLKAKRDDAIRCYDQALSERRRTRRAEARQRLMTDPDLRDRMVGLSQRLGQAQATGDTATARLIQREMGSFSAPTHDDTLHARRLCGPIPPPSAAEATLDSLQHAMSDLDRRIRALEETSIAIEAKASRLTPAQLAMARERIERYLAATRSKSASAPRGFTALELKALAAHREALEAALGNSGE